MHEALHNTKFYYTGSAHQITQKAVRHSGGGM